MGFGRLCTPSSAYTLPYVLTFALPPPFMPSLALLREGVRTTSQPFGIITEIKLPYGLDAPHPNEAFCGCTRPHAGQATYRRDNAVAWVILYERVLTVTSAWRLISYYRQSWKYLSPCTCEPNTANRIEIKMAYVRPLRILTLLTAALATPLNIATTVLSIQIARRYSYWYYRNPSWCYAFIPLAITAAASVFSLVYQRRHGRLPNFKFAIVDLIAALVYLGVLIPIWATEIGRLRGPGYGLLAGYTTAPMIVNM